MVRAFASFLNWSILLLLLIGQLHANDVDYSYVPKKVYQKQVFPISFLSNSSDDDTIHFEFVAEKGPILNEPVIIRNDDKTFYTFYFKTSQPFFKISAVNVQFNGQSKVLPEINIPVVKLPDHPNFCGVIAAGLKVKSYQASVYDEKTNLIAVSLEAHDANLEDMYVPEALKDGLENLRRTGSLMEADYYIVLPSDQTKLKFSYFDTIKEIFVDREIPISIEEGSVAAQTDLNPKDDNFETLKKYTLIGLGVLFILLFIWKRDFFYLIMGVVAAAILLTFFIPLEKICVKSGAPIYIIPAKNSTISLHVDQEYHTTKLGERDDYSKIEYRNGIIGWIKNEDLCKN